MRIVSKPIEMIAWFPTKNQPRPLRFRIQQSDESYEVIHVHRIQEVRKERLAGIDSFVFRCESEVRNQLQIYELKYLIRECRWLLYKI